MTEWQPIETAPKDGYFLVYLPGHHPVTGNVTSARFRAGNPFFIGSNMACDVDPPSHWMPLPEPPK